MPDQARPLTPITESNTTTPRGSKFVEHEEWPVGQHGEGRSGAGTEGRQATAVSNPVSHTIAASMRETSPQPGPHPFGSVQTPSLQPGVHLVRSPSRSAVQKRPYTSPNYVSTRVSPPEPPSPAVSTTSASGTPTPSFRLPTSATSVKSTLAADSCVSVAPPPLQKPAIRVRCASVPRLSYANSIRLAQSQYQAPRESPLQLTTATKRPGPSAAPEQDAAGTIAARPTLEGPRTLATHPRPLSAPLRPSPGTPCPPLSQTVHKPSLATAPTALKPSLSTPAAAPPEIGTSPRPSAAATATTIMGASSSPAKTLGTRSGSASTTMPPPASIDAASTAPTRIPVRLHASTPPSCAPGAGVQVHGAGPSTPAPVRTSYMSRSLDPNVPEQHAPRPSTPFRMTRSVSALETRSVGVPAAAWHAGAEFPPRPTTATDTRRRPNSASLSGLARPVPSTPQERPSSFHGLSPSLALRRANSVLKGYSSSTLDQIDATLAVLTARRSDSLDLPKDGRRTPSRSASRDRQRRVSFQFQPQSQSQSDPQWQSQSQSQSLSQSPSLARSQSQSRAQSQSQSPSSPTPADEDRRRPNSALARRPSRRITSLLSRFNKPTNSSPLNIITQLPDVSDTDLARTSPILAAIRAADRFSIHDDEYEDFEPHLQHLHRRTSDGSIVAVPAMRILYAENPDTPSLSTDSDLEDLDNGGDTAPPDLTSLVQSVSDSLSVTVPSLSRSSSDANASDESSKSPVSVSASPCSAAQELRLHFDSLVSLTHTTQTSLSSVSLAESRSEPDAALFAAHVLNTHAANLLRQAETMSEVSRTMRAQADESFEWVARLMEHASSGNGGDAQRVPEMAALGLRNLAPLAPAAAATAPPLPLGSRSRRSSGAFTPTPSSSVSRPSRHARHTSLPAGSPPHVPVHPSPSLPSLPEALAHAERLGQDGWANLRATSDVWTHILATLKLAAEEDVLKPECKHRGTQTESHAELAGRSRCSTPLSKSRLSNSISDSGPVVQTSTSTDEKSQPFSHRPSFTGTLEHHRDHEEVRTRISSPAGAPPSAPPPPETVCINNTDPAATPEASEQWTPTASDELPSSPSTSTDEWGVLIAGSQCGGGETTTSPLELSPDLSPTSPLLDGPPPSSSVFLEQLYVPDGSQSGQSHGDTLPPPPELHAPAAQDALSRTSEDPRGGRDPRESLETGTGGAGGKRQKLSVRSVRSRHRTTTPIGNIVNGRGGSEASTTVPVPAAAKKRWFNVKWK